MTSTLSELVAAIQTLSPETATFLQSKTEFRTYTRGEVLVRTGEVNDIFYFLQTGLARTFYLYEDQEITTWFFWEDSFMNIPSRYFFQKPSKEYLQIMENSVVLCIKREDLEYVYKSDPKLYQLNKNIMEDYFGYFDERLRLLLQKPEERYAIFQRDYKAIANRVPQKHIATFLGIAPETLSRIRAKCR